jgi:hypothetical protein
VIQGCRFEQMMLAIFVLVCCTRPRASSWHRSTHLIGMVVFPTRAALHIEVTPVGQLVVLAE